MSFKVRIVWLTLDKRAGSSSNSNSTVSTFDIFPESETNFFITIVGTSLIFTKNPRGEVLSAVRHADGWTEASRQMWTGARGYWGDKPETCAVSGGICPCNRGRAELNSCRAGKIAL
jgi:hypothetical protein